LLSLHGQNKDALSKIAPGSWRYDIELPGYKFNMTDISAAIGLGQLARYDSEIIPRRKKIVAKYCDLLKENSRFILPLFATDAFESCYHLFPLRIADAGEFERNNLIARLAECGISTNVHFIPVVMHSFYRSLGFDIKDFPNAYDLYKNEISLPVYTRLDTASIEFVCSELIKHVK